MHELLGRHGHPLYAAESTAGKACGLSSNSDDPQGYTGRIVMVDRVLDIEAYRILTLPLEHGAER